MRRLVRIFTGAEVLEARKGVLECHEDPLGSLYEVRYEVREFDGVVYVSVNKTLMWLLAEVLDMLVLLVAVTDDIEVRRCGDNKRFEAVRKELLWLLKTAREMDCGVVAEVVDGAERLFRKHALIEVVLGKDGFPIAKAVAVPKRGKTLNEAVKAVFVLTDRKCVAMGDYADVLARALR